MACGCHSVAYERLNELLQETSGRRIYLFTHRNCFHFSIHKVLATTKESCDETVML